MQVPAACTEACPTIRASEDICLDALGDALVCSDDAVHHRPVSTHSVDSNDDTGGVPSSDMKSIDQAAKVPIALHVSLCLLYIPMADKPPVTLQ